MPELVQQFVQLHDDRQLDILRVRDFYKYCLELQSTRAALQDTQHVAQSNDADGAVPTIDVFQSLATWSVPQSPWTVPQVDETRLHKAVWGRHAMMSLLAWLRACAWPPDEENPSQHAKLGISWTEIAIAVPIRHGMWMPVKRIQQDNQEHILQPRTLSECHLLKITLAEQSAKISWMVKNLSSMLMQDVLPPISQGKVPALLVYGFRASTGLKVRSQFPEQSQIVSILHAYFPRTDWMQALPDLNFDNLSAWAEDTELRNDRDVRICRGVVFVPKMAIRYLRLWIAARATFLQMLGGRPSWSMEKALFQVCESLIICPDSILNNFHLHWKKPKNRRGDSVAECSWYSADTVASSDSKQNFLGSRWSWRSKLNRQISFVKR